MSGNGKIERSLPARQQGPVTPPSLRQSVGLVGEPHRNFAFDDRDFVALSNLIRELTGIDLNESKRELVYGRVSRRLRVLAMSSFREYRLLLATPAGKNEMINLCNAITTNHTFFFRENYHFDYLKNCFLKGIAVDSNRPPRIRIWSAGCSTGEEPYSIAMAICEALTRRQRADIKVLATDLDSDVLNQARLGVYKEDSLSGIDPHRVRRFFRKQIRNGRASFEALSELKDLIVFKQLNLISKFPMRGPLDVVFCRNVAIYFDRETQRQLYARVADLQHRDGLLFLGHSESLYKTSEDYALIGRTIYRRN